MSPAAGKSSAQEARGRRRNSGGPQLRRKRVHEIARRGECMVSAEARPSSFRVESRDSRVAGGCDFLRALFLTRHAQHSLALHTHDDHNYCWWVKEILFRVFETGCLIVSAHFFLIVCAAASALPISASPLALVNTHLAPWRVLPAVSSAVPSLCRGRPCCNLISPWLFSSGRHVHRSRRAQGAGDPL